MAVEPSMLICTVDGETRRLASMSVVRVSLRLPVSHGPDGGVVEFDSLTWPVVDERVSNPAMEDHFVFVQDDRGPRVIVVDRVVGLETAGSNGETSP